jgi:D-alanine--poly(phosphoribitol) ligase subunit 1
MKDIVDYFFNNVNNHGNSLAVVENSRKTTYSELGMLVKKIASFIKQKNTSYPKVAIYLPQGSESYAAMIATLYSGGFYTPINLNAPLNRQFEILNQFQPDFVISKYNLFKPLSKKYPNIKLVDIDNLDVKEVSWFEKHHELAYVIFTSGSSGEPKGVMIPRAALNHYIQWSIREMNISNLDRWSQHPNIAFDLSVLDIYGALCGGATLYPLISKKDRLFPAEFIRKNQLTIWNSVPSVIDLMIRAKQVININIDSLRLLTFCGEPLMFRHLSAIFEANSHAIVNNTYGPTEATVSCTLITLNADNYKQYCKYNASFGEPIQNMDIRLVNGGNSDEGEIVLTGPQLAIGYWNNIEETLKSFKTLESEKVSYYTGDWAIRHEGSLYFSERIDNQVKIKGNRVELGEIDSALMNIGYKNVCTVFAKEKLYCFIETSEKINQSNLILLLKNDLPDYEIPHLIYAIKSLPRNGNDKIDRIKLIKSHCLD